MKAKTTTARFKAPAAAVYAFIADIDNFPRWATTFCLAMRREGNDVIVNTPDGDVYFRIEADGKTGILDMWSGPTKDHMLRWPARVIDDNFGGSVFIFTAIQTPDDSDEIFAGQCAALAHEMRNIAEALGTEVVV